MSLSGGGVSLREFSSIQEELLYLREQVDDLSSNEFSLVSVVVEHRREKEQWVQERLELKRQSDELLRENEELKKAQAQAKEDDLKKEARVSWRLEKAARRLREERALKKDARTNSNDLEMRLAKLKEELADTKLALRHETEDHKSTYSALYQHLLSCPEAEKTVESVKKMRATKKRLREYVSPTGYFVSRGTEDEWNRFEEACDPIHDRFHDHDDQEDFFLW
jgi:chromosome segregation ATPase